MQNGFSHFAISKIMDTNVQYIKGVGPKKAEAFKTLGIRFIKDLLLHIPSYFIDRRKIIPMPQAISGHILSQVVKVGSIEASGAMRAKKPTKIYCGNKTGSISLIYFNVQKSFLQEKFRIGSSLVISGKVEWHLGELQMIHPDIVEHEMLKDSVLSIEAVYPSTARLNSRAIAKAIHSALDYIMQIPEWLPESLIQQKGWFNWMECVKKLHRPKTEQDLSQVEKFRERLAFDELLSEQIELQKIRSQLNKCSKKPIFSEGMLLDKLISALPFELTADQESAIKNITNEQNSNRQMLRLLQGDVGSGKTIVVFAAMANAVDAGYQSALMVPTEILAKQHFSSLGKFAEILGIKISLLVSKMTAKEKKQVCDDIEKGNTHLIIGTHALIQGTIKFKKLGMIVVDEQHKFGVEQRRNLLNKGFNCDFLMMSATPIPRTMTMVCYGDMDISVIKSKPKNRIPIKTSLLPAKRIDELKHRISETIKRGSKVYWVCPLIEESESMSLTNVNERFQSLQEIFGDQVGLVHSKLSVAQKEEVMEEFANRDGKVKILVSTTVIEVGIDVPDATIMILENSERFGLAQMHQLRGRVGRGDKQSYCILLYSYPLSDIGKKRLEIMRSSNDGFYLAEQDLLIRGGGKIAGTQQSGIPEFKVFDTQIYQHLIEEAHNLAEDFFKKGFDKELDIMLGIYRHSNKIIEDAINI